MNYIETNRVKELFYEYKKRKIRRKKRCMLVISLLLFCLIICLLYVCANKERLLVKKPADYATMVEVGAKADITTESFQSQLEGQVDKDSLIVASPSVATKKDSSKRKPVKQYDNVYNVPETSLGKVEDIHGDNSYDESVYKKVSDEPIDINYFSNALFVGDSRTEGMLLYSDLPNMNAYTYKGLSVDKLDSEVCIKVDGFDKEYTCYDALKLVTYDSYYLMFGVNELGWVYSDAFVDKFNELVEYILDINPNAIIYVESILPVTSELSAKDEVYNQDKIEEFNKALKDMCDANSNVIYLDIASSVKNEDGYLPAEASNDGVHCNADYCKRIIQYIRCNVYEKISE